MTDRTLLIADLHGGFVPGHPGLDAFHATFLPYLQRRGWRIEEHDGTRLLTHPHETLVTLGDAIDRGPSSVDAALLLYGSYAGALERGRIPSVITLLGNHDERLRARFLHGRRISAEDFRATEAAFRARPDALRQVLRWIDMLPLTYHTRTWRAVHAEFSADPRRCLYGSVDRSRTDDGFPHRIPWWQTPPEKLTFFGHYHRRSDWLDPTRGSVCLDNWAAGEMTIAIVTEDGAVDVERERVA
jgi:hypothetical protein